MKIIYLIIAAILTGPIVSAQNDAAAKNRDLLVRAKNILFLGDSITAHGGYVSNFDTWLHAYYPKRKFNIMNLGLSSETVSGLSEPGHAGGRFPRPYIHTRLDSVLKVTKPDLVFVCYGMNCGIYQPFDAARFQKYQDGITKLKKKVEATGAKVIFITPPYFDGKVAPNKAFYTDVLAKYSAWLVSMQKSGWNVIDLNTDMTNRILTQRKTNPNFTVQRDSIHPDDGGHWMMAQPIIAWFGDAESAQCNNIQEVLTLHKLPASIATLVSQRQQIMHSAWLTKAGHTRPDTAKGLPFAEAQKQEKEINRKLKALFKLTSL